MFVISNVEPFETRRDATVAAKKLGSDYSIYELDMNELHEEDLDSDSEDEDEDEFDEDDLDDDEDEDI